MNTLDHDYHFLNYFYYSSIIAPTLISDNNNIIENTLTSHKGTTK